MNCDESKEYFIDYIDGTLNDEEQAKVSEHLECCMECREELKSLQSLIKDIQDEGEAVEIPLSFMDNIRNGVYTTKPSNSKTRKRPFKMLLIAAAILTMSVATVFADNNPFYELIKLINPEARIKSMADKGVGEKLNIVKVDKDIKVTITNVVADDIQTLISYKVEDLENSRKYKVDYMEGINVKEKWVKTITDTDIPMYTSIFDSEGKGTLTLHPIDTEEKVIHLSFDKLTCSDGEQNGVVEGNWEFEVPIKKLHGKSYDINTTVRVDGYNIDFTKITMSPTLTTVYFNCRGGNPPRERILGLEDLRIKADGKEYRPYNFGHQDWNPYSTIGSGDNRITFEPMLLDNPKNLEIEINRINVEIKAETEKEFVVDLAETKPQEFEYLGTKIIVDNLKIEKDITFDLKQPNHNKDFQNLHADFRPQEGFGQDKHFSSLGNHNEVYFMDKENNKYDYYDGLSRWDEIRDKSPVIYIAKTSCKLWPSEKFDIKKEKTFKIVIGTYTKTVFVDKTFKVKLR